MLKFTCLKKKKKTLTIRELCELIGVLRHQADSKRLCAELHRGDALLGAETNPTRGRK